MSRIASDGDKFYLLPPDVGAGVVIGSDNVVRYKYVSVTYLLREASNKGNVPLRVITKMIEAEYEEDLRMLMKKKMISGELIKGVTFFDEGEFESFIESLREKGPTSFKKKEKVLKNLKEILKDGRSVIRGKKNAKRRL